MHYLGQIPDLPLPHTGQPRLRTRRKPLPQIILCQGCLLRSNHARDARRALDWLKRF